MIQAKSLDSTPNDSIKVIRKERKKVSSKGKNSKLLLQDLSSSDEYGHADFGNDIQNLYNNSLEPEPFERVILDEREERRFSSYDSDSENEKNIFQRVVIIEKAKMTSDDQDAYGKRPMKEGFRKGQ